MKLGIIGATGAVGKVFLDLLPKSKLNVSELRLTASERSIGKKIKYNNTDYIIQENSEDFYVGLDYVFSSASAEVSKKAAEKSKKHNAIMIDDSSEFRMNEDVPLVVPEINSESLKSHNGVVAIPNCTTTPLAMILDAVRSEYNLKRVIVDTYQAVSGTGNLAIKELLDQTKHYLDNGTISDKKNVYSHNIGLNLIPHVESPLDNLYTKEEMKMLYETRKILSDPELKISATCVRVPVIRCHSESINIEFDKPPNINQISKILNQYNGITVLDDIKNDLYPTPLFGEGKHDIFIGRLRNDISNENAINLWVVSDNLIKGAALNAIQILEVFEKIG
jgi:aspartate-semialdehyde dehydrogenase